MEFYGQQQAYNGLFDIFPEYGAGVPDITIDGITFRIICISQQYDKYDDGSPVYYELDENAQAQMTAAGARGPGATYHLNSRDMVCFISSAQPDAFLYAYRSSSELGIWRSGYIRRGDFGLYKGKLDYVQGTLLHHKLQGLINTHWEHTSDATYLIPYLQQSGAIAYAPLYGQEVEVQAYGRELKTLRRGHNYCLALPFADRSIEAIIDNTNRLYMETSRYDIFQLFSQDRFQIIKQMDCGNSDLHSLSTMYNKLTELGDILAKGFTIGNLTLDSNHTFEEKYAAITAEIKLGSCDLYLSDGTPHYKLIFCTYTAKFQSKQAHGVQKKVASGCYGVALLPYSCTVNAYGIYSQYVRAHLFICKPFMYISMCQKADNLLALRCLVQYIYSGFIYESCFPYNKIFEVLNGGSFRYEGPGLTETIRSLQYNSKYQGFDENSLTGQNEVNTLCYSSNCNPGAGVAGGTKPHKKGKSHKKRKTQRKKTKRKTQKRRPYSIFRSNK